MILLNDLWLSAESLVQTLAHTDRVVVIKIFTVLIINRMFLN